MSDSDNEYTRKRRSKFQGERSGTTKYRRTEKLEERSNYSRYRDQSSRVRDRSDSFNFEQASKRFKCNDYHKTGYHNNRYQNYQQVRPSQLTLMPFKTFILTQDDRISESDGITNYQKYKLKFQIQQFEQFFEAHKNEEWLRIKYHPEDSKKHKEEQANALKRRCNVFLELLNANKIDCVNVDSDKTNNLLKILDMVVLKLEGGTEEDIATLEKEYLELENKNQNEVEQKVDDEKENTKEIEIADCLDKSESNHEKLSEQVENKNQNEVEQKVDDKKENTKEIEIADCLDKSESNHEKLSEQVAKVEKEEVKMKKHKTSSICLRNLSSTITRKEIESICSKYDGFIRICLSEPKPQNNWIRQGWVTFTQDSSVKEICNNINKLRVKDSELDAVVTEDLPNRICLVNGITSDKRVVKSDIRLSAKIALHLDKQAGLWLDNDQETKTIEENPVLRNASDYLVEEASSEEDLTLKAYFEKSDEINFNQDDNLIAVLDKIILYLRIVHSVDYYNHCKYPNEDEMPNRCEIFHVRGPPPLHTSKTEISQFLGKEMEAKLAQFLPEKLNETESELVNLGLKDFDKEVDKFVAKNTKELGPNKWQCPLSGKKFKSRDFVRKHIFLKYCDKIEEVKTNAEFFNNYLRDPKRMVSVVAQSEKQKSCIPPFYNHGGFVRNYGSHPVRVMSAQSTSRELIQYNDLDAPVEIEELY